MDKARAQQVLARIDEILRWEQRTDQQKDQKFADLGSIMAFVPHTAPTSGAHTEAVLKLQSHFNRIDQRLKGSPEDETEGFLDEAIRNVRPGYRERE